MCRRCYLTLLSIDLINDVDFSAVSAVKKIICKEPCDLNRKFNVLTLSAMS